MDPKKISTVCDRELGAGVQPAIAISGVSQAELARILGWQESKISVLHPASVSLFAREVTGGAA